MKVRVRWRGFYDNMIHESDIMEKYSEVIKFIIEDIGNPAALRAYLVDAVTGEQVRFNDFKNLEEKEHNE